MASACRLFDRFHGFVYSRHVGYIRPLRPGHRRHWLVRGRVGDVSFRRGPPDAPDRVRNCSAQDEMPAAEFPAER